MTGSDAEKAFDSEVFEYWIPRLVADGMDVKDVNKVLPQVASWDDWPGAWEKVGDTYLSLARERLSQGSAVSAGEAFVRASLCFHVGQVVANHTPAVKRDLQRRKEAAFRDAAPHLLPPAERLEIDHNGVTPPGCLRMPVHGEASFACVVLVPGLNSTKEDFITLSEMFARRGLASFAFDGPGQGGACPCPPERRLRGVNPDRVQSDGFARGYRRHPDRHARSQPGRPLHPTRGGRLAPGQGSGRIWRCVRSGRLGRDAPHDPGWLPVGNRRGQ
jgi:hypothetical protein